MPTTYTMAGGEVSIMLQRVMQAYHGELHTAGVKVGILMAYNDTGAAIKHHGTAARATIKVVSLKDRVTKGYDAELLIDQIEFELMRDKHIDALIDHELCHLELVLKKGKPQFDDLGRPRLRTVPGDWDAGDGFRAVVARHGDYAPEFENLRRAIAAAEAAREEARKDAAK